MQPTSLGGTNAASNSPIVPCMGTFLVRARPAPGRRSLGGANCRWAQPLSRPQPPEAVAEGQPLQGLGPSTTIGAEFTPASGLVFHPILRAEGKGWREAERVRRGAVGMRFLCGVSTGSRVTMTFGAAKAIMGSARLGFEGNYTAGAKIIAPQPCIRWVLQPEP